MGKEGTHLLVTRGAQRVPRGPGQQPGEVVKCTIVYLSLKWERKARFEGEGFWRNLKPWMLIRS